MVAKLPFQLSQKVVNNGRTSLEESDILNLVTKARSDAEVKASKTEIDTMTKRAQEVFKQHGSGEKSSRFKPNN